MIPMVINRTKTKQMLRFIVFLPLSCAVIESRQDEYKFLCLNFYRYSWRFIYCLLKEKRERERKGKISEVSRFKEQYMIEYTHLRIENARWSFSHDGCNRRIYLYPLPISVNQNLFDVKTFTFQLMMCADTPFDIFQGLEQNLSDAKEKWTWPMNPHYCEK